MAKVIVLDCETTGLNQPEFIEVAYFELGNVHSLHSTHLKDGWLEDITKIFDFEFEYFLERFYPSKAIEPGASKVNGIYRKDLTHCKKSSEFEMPEGVEFLIGHNIAFDKRALNFNPKNILVSDSVKMICTKKLTQLVITGQRNNRLVTLVEHLYPEHSEELLKTAHTALQDCKLTYLVLLKILEKLPQITEWEQLANLCSQGKKSYEEMDKPLPKITKMPFGKYKNQLLVDIPTSYLNWCLENMDLQPPLKSAIQEVLK